MENSKDVWVLGHKITPIEVSGNYDMVVGETPPQVPGPPPHSHSSLKELFMVLEGEMDFVVDGEQRRVTAGGVVDLPSHVVHTFSNAGTKPCRWVNIHSPKGFRSFFDDLGVSVHEENAMQKSVHQDIIDKVIATAADYDMHIKV